MSKWQFWIDRGGTFTDIVARRPNGTLVTHKLLSENPTQYTDAAIAGIRQILGIPSDGELSSNIIECVKMGTTVATNALLEREGERVAFITSTGLGDVLRIGTQARPNLFDLDVTVALPLYDQVIEIDERVRFDGSIIQPLNPTTSRKLLQTAYESGCTSAAIALVHGYRHHKHEEEIEKLAKQVGFTHISVSHKLSPLMRLVSRGGTTVADAYLTPVLQRYVRQVTSQLPDIQVLFMQSNGGLTKSNMFQGKDALLSGPAGGVIGMIKTGERAGYKNLIGFDMGGTSTDVSHYAGELERTKEITISNITIRSPSLSIYTIASGGGSILKFDGNRMRVGPESAGAKPGPACYGAGGPLTVTDCNVILGKLRGEYFPRVFGKDGKQKLNDRGVREKFEQLTKEICDTTGISRTPAQIAEGYLAIAIENMSNAIKKISVQQGHDISAYTLSCFGGAGGQHACLVAERLGIRRILVHPYAGVLSAFGIGLADIRYLKDLSVELQLEETALDGLKWKQLETAGKQAVMEQNVKEEDIDIERSLFIRYEGSDTTLRIKAGNIEQIEKRFESTHMARFGFISKEKSLIIESIQVETIGRSRAIDFVINTDEEEEEEEEEEASGDQDGEKNNTWPIVTGGNEYKHTLFLKRESLKADKPINGPIVILESTGTTVVEPGWSATIRQNGDLVMERRATAIAEQASTIETKVDPVQLEIFNNLFMNIAEQMGVILQNTSISVNIKERLDFSCAIFNSNGELVANAPHIPVHLGSMEASIKSIINTSSEQGTMKRGNVWALNAPYNGGTHLPDITVVKPVFLKDEKTPSFYVGSRGHHADIGGIVPGSCAANSTHVKEEGVLLDGVLLVKNGEFLEEEIVELLTNCEYPARKPQQNVADLKAQVAACTKGANELLRIVEYYGVQVVHAYMKHVQSNAEECVRRQISKLRDGQFTYEMDDGSRISVKIEINRKNRSAVFDFTGTSGIHRGNWNAPKSITYAATLYVMRLLVGDDIPLNSGCLLPITLIIPDNTMINPSYPAAVVAGNVETSQVVVDCLLGALKIAGASQGTMNNLIFGNNLYQYYETICGGSGATQNSSGCSAVHTHMTNSRLTDVEVLEWRYPVILLLFRVRFNSGGAGLHRGGDGVVRRLKFEQNMQVNVLSGRRCVPPYGACGGMPGKVGYNRKIRIDGSIQEFGGQVQTTVEKGECFEIETPGGGGYGAVL